MVGILLAVSDIEKAKTFYETVMEQKVADYDGVHMADFESGFSLAADYVGVVEGGKEPFSKHPTGAKIVMKTKANNFQLAFEVQDLGYWVRKVKSADGIELVHDVTEYNWGQRVIRFYDYDGHIVEIGESGHAVVKRLLSQGLSVEEIAERTWDTVENVQQLLGSE